MANARNTNLEAIMLIVNELFSDSDSSDEDNEDDILLLSSLPVNNSQFRLPRIQNYVEQVVPLYSPSGFKEHFRLNSSTFEIVLPRIAAAIVNSSADNSGRPTIPPHKQFLLALWYFGTPDSYRSVCDRFDVGRATAVRTVRRVTAALFDLASQEIEWPFGARLREVTAGFKSVANFPGVIGAIDGSHIPIPAPKENPIAYYNRKGFHSILLQAVCDHEAKFIHCYAGEVGSVHDARVFRKSEIQLFIDNERETKFPNDSHLLGDPAYQCLNQVMVPFKDNGNLTQQQKNYNYCQSSTRCVVERAFALLKGRMRCLKFLDMQDMMEIPKLIIACCVLHNICISQNDNIENDPSDEECRPNNDSEDRPNDAPRHNSGNLKRLQIAATLPIKQRSVN